MASDLALLGEELGRAIQASRSSAVVPAISLTIDPAPVADAVRHAVSEAETANRASIELLGKQLAGLFETARGEGLGEAGAALDRIFEALSSRNDLSAEVLAVADAIRQNSEALKEQARQAQLVVSALEAMARRAGADRVVDYDEQGRIKRVRVI
jgi:hypothetical protein